MRVGWMGECMSGYRIHSCWRVGCEPMGLEMDKSLMDGEFFGTFYAVSCIRSRKMNTGMDWLIHDGCICAGRNRSFRGLWKLRTCWLLTLSLKVNITCRSKCSLHWWRPKQREETPLPLEGDAFWATETIRRLCCYYYRYSCCFVAIVAH